MEDHRFSRSAGKHETLEAFPSKPLLVTWDGCGDIQSYLVSRTNWLPNDRNPDVRVPVSERSFGSCASVSGHFGGPTDFRNEFRSTSKVKESHDAHTQRHILLHYCFIAVSKSWGCPPPFPTTQPSPHPRLPLTCLRNGAGKTGCQEQHPNSLHLLLHLAM